MIGKFTDAEIELARLIADGLTYEQMGRRLGIPARTVKFRTDNLRRKLDVRNKRTIPKILRELGVI